MRVALFFVCLCFLLLKVDSSLYAGMQHYSIGYTSARHPQKANEVKLVSASKDCAVITDAGVDTKMEYLISDDVEDEDTNDFSSPKDRLPARSHAVYSCPVYPAVLKYHRKYYKAPPSFFGQISDKCILHSVFRL